MYIIKVYNIDYKLIYEVVKFIYRDIFTHLGVINSVWGQRSSHGGGGDRHTPVSPHPS